MPLPEKLWKETFLYTSDKPIDELRSDIDALLQRTRGLHFDVNLTGSFSGPDTFELTPKWSLGNFQGFGDRDISHLYGELIQQNNETLVRVTVRPNIGIIVAVFLVPAILIPLLAFGSTDLQGRITLSIIAIVFPTWFYFIGIRYPKNAIRNRFARTFDLRKTVDERLPLPDTNP
jgi:hypothetical protein